VTSVPMLNNFGAAKSESTAHFWYRIPAQEQTSVSDITATGEVPSYGTVEINTPDVDPSLGLVSQVG